MLERRGVTPTEDESPEPGAVDTDRRILTRMRPSASISDSACIGSRPSSEMTSPSTSIAEISAAIPPGNCSFIRTVAARYSKRNKSRVYLQSRIHQPTKQNNLREN